MPSNSIRLTKGKRLPIRKSSEPEKDSHYRLSNVTEPSLMTACNSIIQNGKRVKRVFKGRKSHSLFAICLMLFMIWMCTKSSETGTKISLSAPADSESNVHDHSQSTTGRELSSPPNTGTLDTLLLPTAARSSPYLSQHERRLIFIGDIHGCISELTDLLQKLDYNANNDHIIALGDMINKGPDSGAVIDFLRNQRASCVRGNHEELIMHRIAQGVIRPLESSQNSAGAQILTPEQISYVQSCPIILRVGKIGPSEYVAVHGGLVASLPLDQQDPYHVMNMRIIDIVTHEPSKDHEKAGSVPWTNLWNDHQRQIISQDNASNSDERSRSSVATTVVYGHDAKRGLQIKPYSKGLDSGCVKGKKLTAFVVNGLGEEEIVQVKCRDHRS